jgi:glucose/arabinose dehydrogenase
MLLSESPAVPQGERAWPRLSIWREVAINNRLSFWLPLNFVCVALRFRANPFSPTKKLMKTMTKRTDSRAFSRAIRYFFTTGFMAALVLIVTTGTSYAMSAGLFVGGFDSPVTITAPPGDTGRIFVVEQTGKIKIVKLPARTVNAIPFLDLSGIVSIGGEQGLLGLAFDPNYATNGRFYVAYTTPGGAFGTCVSHISEFQVSGNPDIADPGSEAPLIVVDHPQGQHQMHHLAFSPRPGDEGNLYIASGDGGGTCDNGTGHAPGGNGQSTATFFGKILRIHPEAAPGTYTIPPDNPFFGSPPPVKQEIWAYGLRNPWKSSWDRQTLAMFIGDVGQATREEIDVQRASNPGGGENFGWRYKEGFVQSPCSQPTPPPGLTDPIFDYDHTVGISIIGGYMYRGRKVPDLRGLYVFGDTFGPDGGDFTGKIWTFRYNGHTVSDFQDITSQLFPTGIGNFPLVNPVAFWEDQRGELYIVSYGNGNIYKILR